MIGSLGNKFSLSCVSTDSFDNCHDPVGHLRYMRKLAAKPYRVIENDFLMAKHGHAIVRRNEGGPSDVDDVMDNLDAFLVQNIAEETILDAENNSITVHRIFVASNRGGEYCQVGWVIKEQVPCCMRCKVSVPNPVTDRRHCSACGDVVCVSCCSNSAVIEELRTMEKFSVCSGCFKGEDVEIEAVKKFGHNNDPTTEGGGQQICDLAAQLASVAKISSTGSSDSHLSFIRSMAKKPILEVRKAYEMAKDGRALVHRRSSFSFSRAVVEAYLVSRLTVESLEITSNQNQRINSSSNSKRIKLYRVYVTSTGGGEYCQIGWVVQDSATHCMQCRSAFGMLSSKHNCVGCGNVVCGKCSSNRAIISELRSEDPHRVCVVCLPMNKETNASSKSISSIYIRIADTDAIDVPSQQSRSNPVTPMKKGSQNELFALLSPPPAVESSTANNNEIDFIADTSNSKLVVPPQTPMVNEEAPENSSDEEVIATLPLETGESSSKSSTRVAFVSQPSITEIPYVHDDDDDDFSNGSDDEAPASPVVGTKMSPAEAGMTHNNDEETPETLNAKTNCPSIDTISKSTSFSSQVGLSRTGSDSSLLVPSTPKHGQSLSASSFYSSHNLVEELMQEDTAMSSVLTYNSEALDKEGLLSSDGSTAVIPIERLSEHERITLSKRGFLPENSTHAFVPVFKLHLRHVEPVKKEVKKFQLPEVKLQHVSVDSLEKKKTIERRPSAASMVQLRPVKSVEKLLN